MQKIVLQQLVIKHVQLVIYMIELDVSHVIRTQEIYQMENVFARMGLLKLHPQMCLYVYVQNMKWIIRMFLKLNHCLSCGDENITHRQLVNGDCVCKSGYQAVKYQYACEVDTWDERLLTFKFKTDTSNQYQQAVVNLFDSNIDIVSELTKLIKASYLQDTATSSVSKYYFDLEQNQEKFFFKSDIPVGQYYQRFQQNVFAVGYIQPKEKQSVLWKFDSTASVSQTSNYYTSRVFERQWNVGMFQYQKGYAVYIQVIITSQEETGRVTRRRFLAEDYSIYQAMYFFYIGYSKFTFFSDAECEKLIDALMSLINGCQKYCDDCYFNQNEQYCKSCQLNRVNQNGNCLCKYETTDQSQCYEPCNGLDCIACINGFCISCPDGMKPPCNSPIIKCDEGYYQENSICKGCAAPCATCTSSIVCTTCIDTYYFAEQTCEICIDGCLKCTTSTDCSICIEGFFYEDDQCYVCTPDCVKCQAKNYCNTCVTGKYSNSFGQCEDCPSICTSCTSNNNCQSCIDGYYNNVGYCNKCQSVCSKCLNSSQCTQCIPGYYVKGFSCFKCADNCTTCFDLPDNCASCISSYTLIMNKCIKCTSPCDMCQNSSTECLSCEIQNYLVANNKCQTCSKGCKQCSGYNDRCFECSPGYFLENLKCIQCNAYCRLCTARYTCTSCPSGYYLNFDNCLPCPIECSDCTFQAGSIICNTCASGYFKNSSTCEKCQEPCFNCQTSATHCLDCIIECLFLMHHCTMQILQLDK
ncbi:unnamed protein product (macronuclear) [Paramecium tetraurelia]|uniref:EGF-like domain-containing protein n=1 Tax=Paramecium tetraurelia TaxID=5888 RepID=A0CLQ4_PARTE|nr:uncharacterized protein GSPATT00038646001 [Paramecium tetraurelia]CAK71721.1 unnamed protein product [Paramecium tetraurelia]|eukprot:XP_001439118.1 hypothetical protein (macronuclear) [Paramecium tetraurelia strain d4-2]